MKLPVIYNKLSITDKRLVREEYIRRQKSLCIYCQRKLNDPVPNNIRQKKINWSLFPPNFLKYPVHLQHNHKNGLTEGAIHAYCNAVLWQYHGR